MSLITPRQYALMKLLVKYGLEGCADVNSRINFPDSGIFLVPILKEGEEAVEFPFEFLIELDCLLQNKVVWLSKLLRRWKLSRIRRFQGEKVVRRFCFQIEPAITVEELSTRIKAQQLHISLANMCYD